MKKKPRTGSTVSAFVEAVERPITPALATLGFTQEQADAEDLLSLASLIHCFLDSTVTRTAP